MLIRTLTRAAGRLSWRPNQEVDLPDAEAAELIRSGQAVAVVMVTPNPHRGADDPPLAEPLAEPAAQPKKPTRKHR